MNAVAERTSTAAGAEHERRLELFGSSVRVCIGVPRACDLRPQRAALETEQRLRRVHRALSRFEGDSELCEFNARSAPTARVSPLLAMFLLAARRAHGDSGGLVDATVIDAVERAGYRRSRQGVEAAPLADALAAAPPRRPALPTPAGPWSELRVDVEAGTASCAPGVRFDSGGIGKGLAADLCAERLEGFSSFAVDCGGDLRVGGTDGLERPIEVADPFTGVTAISFGLTRGAVATSGIRRRVWRDGSGYAHHLIDPGRGVPAWTGLVQATAVAPTAATAEALAKAAVLAGSAQAGRLLERWGGIVFDDSGRATAHGPLSPGGER